VATYRDAEAYDLSHVYDHFFCNGEYHHVTTCLIKFFADGEQNIAYE